MKFESLFVYFCQKSQKKQNYDEPILMYLQKKNKKIQVKIEDYDLNKILFADSSFNFLPNKFVKKECENDPEMDLFYWAVLTNRIEISKIFWRIGKVCCIK